MFSLHKKFVIHLRTVEIIDSPLRLESRQYLGYSTVLNCLGELSAYDIFSLEGLFVQEKIFVFALFYPKWIDNLLSLNDSQCDENFLLKTLFFQHPYLDRRYKYCQHRAVIQTCLLPVVNYLSILGGGAALRKILVERCS